MEQTETAEFGGWLASRRKQRKWSRGDLAERVGVSQAQVAQWEAGKAAPKEIERIARAYNAWRGEKDSGDYADVPKFCKSATLEEVRAHNFVLTPGRYVGADETVEDDDPFEEKMPKLVAKLKEQFAESSRLEKVILNNLKELGLG